MWVKLCKRLREAGIAHADLQHGNVLLVPGSRPGAYGLKLIDYDGMYVPALANRPSGEVGHPSYQHPTRGSGRAYSLDVDRFPHLVIATALKGLEIIGPDLWGRYDTGDNLLFTEEDFQKPGASKVMRELWRTENSAVQAFVGRLAISSARPIPQTPWLDQIAPDGEPLPLNNDERREAAGSRGIALTVATALPPEPLAVVPLPALPPPALPLPGELAPALTANHLEFDIDESAAPETRRRSPTPEGTSSRRPLLIAGGVLVLLGAVVAGVFLSGGKPGPTNTAGPDDADSKDVPPKAKKPDEVLPKPKSGGGDPAVPRIPISIPTSPDPSQVAISARQRLKFDGAPKLAQFDFEGETIIVLHNGQLTAQRLQDGATVSLPPPRQDVGLLPLLVKLPGKRVGVWTRGDKAITVVDLQTGQPAGTIPLPAMPAGGIDIGCLIKVSPDGRYVACGRRSIFGLKPGAMEKGYLPTPFRLLDTRTGQEPVAIDWASDSLAFNADSSRLLVVDAYVGGRWFKLPSGEPDGAWQFADRSVGLAAMRVEDISRDGRVLLCAGTVQGRPDSHFILDAETGKVQSVLGQNFHTGRLSADGRIATLVETKNRNARDVYLTAFDVARGSEIARLKLPENAAVYPSPCDLSPDGRTVVLNADVRDQSMLVYDLVGKTPGPVAKTPEPERKPVWPASVADARGLSLLHADPDVDLVLLGAPRGGFAAFGFKTGRPRDGFTELATQGVVQFIRMDGGRLGTVASGMDEVLVWDARTGKNERAIAVPEIPPGAGNAKFARVWLSPDGKSLAVGRGGPPVTDNPDVPLQIFDTSSKGLILSTTWKGGSVHFTADSARVLVAEWTGRFRWFQLPSGVAEGGWDLGPPPAGRRHSIYGMSADGSLVAYNGPAGLKDGRQSPAILDGKTGNVIRQFKDHLAVSDLSISADGCRVALLRGFSTDACDIEVLDAASGKLLKQVNVQSGRLLPPYTLSPDGSVLLVFNPEEKKLYRYDLSAQPKAP
jgi:hypothetical protein